MAGRAPRKTPSGATASPGTTQDNGSSDAMAAPLPEGVERCGHGV